MSFGSRDSAHCIFSPWATSRASDLFDYCLQCWRVVCPSTRPSGSHTNARLLLLASAFYYPLANIKKLTAGSEKYITLHCQHGQARRQNYLLLRGRVLLQKSGTNGQGRAAHLSLSYAPITRKVGWRWSISRWLARGVPCTNIFFSFFLRASSSLEAPRGRGCEDSFERTINCKKKL